MAIIQQPDALSLSGNLKKFIVSSGETVSFVLKDGTTVLLDASYEPGADGRVTIDVKDIVDSRLSFLLSSNNFYEQPNIVKVFTAIIDSVETTFKAIRTGVANLADTPANWLKGNFLTWQPTSKPVTYYSPEWLTYYAVEACTIKLKATFPDNTVQNFTLGACEAGKAFTCNLQYAVVAGLLSQVYPSYYEVWAEKTGGTRLTYIQRYLYSEPKSELEQWFLFENSLGGLDTIRAYGDTDFEGDHVHNISSIDGTSSEYRIDTKRSYNQNTGYLNEYERRWLLDFFPSQNKFVHSAGAIRSVIVTDSDVKYTASDLPSSYNFKYRFADDSAALLNLIRNEDAIPADIVIPDIDSPDFSLPPRLSEYPRVTLSEGVILPAFDPFSETPKVTSFGAIRDEILSKVIHPIYQVEDIIGLPDALAEISGSSHSHPNKTIIDQLTQGNLDVLSKLSLVEGNLKIDANAYSTGELSAYGLGSWGSSGGGVDLLQAWTDYDATKDNWAVKAGLLVPFYNDTKSRLTSLEGGAALSLSPVGAGNGVANITKSGTILTVAKANFAELDVNGKILSSQLPSYVDDVLEYANLAAFPATGETGKIYIAQDSNKTYRWSGTAYVEISASLALGETSSTAYRGDRGKTAYDHSQLTGNPHGTTFAQIVSRPTTITGYGITDAYTKTEVNSVLTSKLDKSVFDDLFEKVEVSTGVFAIKAKYNFYGVGEISAYGLGTGGSGGGSYDRLDAWADYNSTKAGWVLSAFLGNELNSRVTNLESGSALTVNTTGTGNAITSISKAGTVITATKGATFSLDGHTHSYLPLSGGTLTGTVTSDTTNIQAAFHKTSATGTAFARIGASTFDKGIGVSNTGELIFGNWVDVNNLSSTWSIIYHTGNFNPGNYLPLSGGVMSNTNLVTNLNANYLAGQDGNYYNQRRYSDANNYFGGYYTSGGNEKPNHAAFGAGKLKLSMLSAGNVGGISGLYVDTLWISAYTGGDVKLGTALHFDKYNQNIYFTKQNYDATDWGTTYTLWTTANLSPVTTNTVQTVTAQKTFSDGDAVYSLSAKPSIILGGNNTTNAGAIKLWGNVAGAYGLLQQATTNTFLDSSSGEVFINNYAAGNVRLVMGGGNVGIGMIPTVKLDVNGAIKSNAGIFSTNTAGSSIIQASTSGVSGFIALKSATTSTVNYIPCVQAVSSQANYGMYLTSEGFDSYGMSAFYFSARNAVGTGAVTSGKIFSINNYTTERFNIDVNGDTTTSRAFRSDSNLGGLTTPIGTGWGQIWGMQGYELTNATTPNTNFFGIATQYFAPTRHIGFFGQGLENAWIGLHDGFAWFKGNVTSNSEILAGGGLRVNQTTHTGIGISLRGENSAVSPIYGLFYAQTALKGTHGAVTGANATYFSMDGVAGRGWIFTNNAGGSTGNVASISNSGNITASGEITAYVASDRRLKHNIAPLFSSLDIIDRLNPVSYYWNQKAKELNPMKSDSLDYGLIAQEVENVLPGVVHGIFDDKYKSIDYIKLIPIMIAAIKELKQKVNKL